MHDNVFELPPYIICVDFLGMNYSLFLRYNRKGVTTKN